jgi:TonB-linked SusC/RagA family outer membrane protein
MKRLNVAKPMLLFLSLLFFPLYMVAQTSAVTGTVSDKSGAPIVGATVMVANTTTGTVTDVNGQYSINVASDAQLVFSFLGYTTQTIAVNGQKTINAVLEDESELLGDVVVVGYGTMKKSDISGSVTTVDQEAVMRRVPQNIGQALQGAAAGVMVTQQDGAPDANAAIRIRGVGTINGDASPLYVVDGIQVGNNANFVNPSDIERMEILKDASATAIYGSAGANGVVMITTKHGKKGQSSINVNADFGLQTLPYTLETLDIDTYAESIREARANDGNELYNKIWEKKYDGQRNEIDWQKEMTRAALRQQYGVSMSGGNEKSQFNLSFGYMDVEGLVINTNYDRLTARANVSTKINKFLEVGGDMNFTHSQSKGSNMALGNNGNMSSLRDFAFMTPTLDYLDENGNLIKVNLENPDGTYGCGYLETSDGWEGNTTIFNNPYASQMENGDRNRNGNNRFQTNGYIDLTFIDNDTHKLDIKTQGSYIFSNNHSSDYTGGRKRYNYINGTLTEMTKFPDKTDQTYSFSLNQSVYYSLGLQTYMTYALTTQNHNFSLMVGNEVGKQWGEWLNASAKNFASVDNRDLSLTQDPSTKQAGGAYNAAITNISYFARASYVLMDRYILTGTIRKDGSSNFGSGNRWGTFPSAALAWRISEEGFMGNVSDIQNLKLRLGWGQTGNAGNMTGRAIAALSAGGAYNFYPEGGKAGAFEGNRDRQPGWYANLADTNLKWETNEMLNIGLDVTFLEDFDVTLDYFIKNTKDLLLTKQIRATSGYASIYTNYGEIQNKGFEFSVKYHKQVNEDFAFNVAVNGSTLKNEVKKMGDPIYSTCSANGAGTLDGSNVQAVGDPNGFKWGNHSICKEGEAVGSFYGFQTDGIIKNEAELAAYKAYLTSYDQNGKELWGDSYGTADVKVGDYRFKDINGDHAINDDDKVILGNGFPALNYGITLGATYKNFDFSMAMNGVIGQEIFSYSAMRLSNMFASDDQTTVNMLKEVYDDSFRNGSGSNARLSLLDYNSNRRASDAWVKKGDFFRVSNLQVGYTLPQDLSEKMSIKNARVYVGVSNLLLISGYKKYGDPEVGQGSVLYTGLDTGRYPMPRTFMAGVNITF